MSSKLLLVFDHSGDSIEFDAIQLDVVEYYVAELNRLKLNDFKYQPAKSPYERADRLSLKRNFSDINEYIIKEFGINDFTEFDLENKYFDQQQLNEIHCAWVKCIKNSSPNIVHMLMDNPEMAHKFQMLNRGVHTIENKWRLRFYNKAQRPPEYISAPVNPFKHDITSFGIASLRIVYHGLGRQTYDKWAMDDDNIDDVDTCNFEDLYGQIDLILSKPHEVQAPAEYVEFCKVHNVIPHGMWVNLANITNPRDNLTRNREIIYNNVTLRTNSAKFVF